MTLIDFHTWHEQAHPADLLRDVGREERPVVEALAGAVLPRLRGAA